MKYPGPLRIFSLFGCLALLASLFLGQPVKGQLALLDDVEIRKQLEDLTLHWEKQPDEESANALIRLVSFRPHTLVAREKGVLSPVSRWVNELFALTPAEKFPERLKQWNTQIKKKLDEGLLKEDLAIVQQCAFTAHGIPSGAEACLWLGDKSIEAGRVEEASYWWSLPLFPGRPNSLVESRPDFRSRLLLAEWCRGDKSSNKRDNIDEMFPSAKGANGKLLGKTGSYRSLLKDLYPLDLRPSQVDWSDYAGNPERNGVSPSRLTPQLLGHWCSLGPMLRVEIGEEESQKQGPIAPMLLPPPPSPDFSVHPIIVEPWLIHQEGRRILATHLGTGKTQKWFDSGANSTAEGNSGKVHSLVFVPPSFVLACLGSDLSKKAFPQEDIPKPLNFQGKLVCLRVKEGGANVHWQAEFPVEQDSQFDSPPLYTEGKVLTAIRSKKDGKETTKLYCHLIDSTQEGELAWSRELGSDSNNWNIKGGGKSSLVRLGPNVLWTGKNGAMIAVDSTTGSPVWAHLPETSEPKPISSLYSGVKALHFNGKLFSLAEGQNKVRGIDPFSGQVLWERECQGANGLAGAWGNIVLLSIENGLRALNSVNGSDKNGWTAPGEGAQLPSSGKGFILGEEYVWPTVKGIFCAGMNSGLPSADLTLFHNAIPGNLSLHNGFFLTTGPVSISVYASEEKWKKYGHPWPKVPSTPSQTSNENSLNSNPTSGKLNFQQAKQEDRILWSAKYQVVNNKSQPQVHVGKNQWYWLRNGVLETRNWDTSLAWQTTLPFPCLGLKEESGIVCLNGTNGVLGLRLEDGKEKWQVRVPGGLVVGGTGGCFFTGGYLVCPKQDGGIAIIDSTTGRLDWATQLPGLGWPLPWAQPELAMAGEVSFRKFFLPDSHGGLWLADLSHKEMRRVQPGDGNTWAATATISGSFFALKKKGEIFCFAHDGTVEWVFPAVPSTLSTGAPGVLRVFGESLITAIPTNLGFFVQRLAISKPRYLWPSPLVLGDVKSPDQIQLLGSLLLIPLDGEVLLADAEKGIFLPTNAPKALAGNREWNCAPFAQKALLWTKGQKGLSLQLSLLGLHCYYQSGAIFPREIEIHGWRPGQIEEKSIRLGSNMGRGKWSFSSSPTLDFLPIIKTFSETTSPEDMIVAIGKDLVMVQFPGGLYCLRL